MSTRSGLARGGHRKRVALRLVVDRDGTRCRRCDGTVDVRLSGNHPDGPTLGHVIAASRGGTDELANLSLEHKRCNLVAGDRDDPPRALIATPVSFVAPGGRKPRSFARNGAPADYLRKDASR
jgi:5-methylcytosine-specific restriction endonuclease McrA